MKHHIVQYKEQSCGVLMTLLTVIQNKLGKKPRHTTMPITIRERGLTV